MVIPNSLLTMVAITAILRLSNILKIKMKSIHKHESGIALVVELVAGISVVLVISLIGWGIASHRKTSQVASIPTGTPSKANGQNNSPGSTEGPYTLNTTQPTPFSPTQPSSHDTTPEANTSSDTNTDTSSDTNTDTTSSDTNTDTSSDTNTDTTSSDTSDPSSIDEFNADTAADTSTTAICDTTADTTTAADTSTDTTDTSDNTATNTVSNDEEVSAQADETPAAPAPPPNAPSRPVVTGFGVTNSTFSANHHNHHRPTIHNAHERPKSSPRKSSTGGTAAPRNLSGQSNQPSIVHLTLVSTVDGTTGGVDDFTNDTTSDADTCDTTATDTTDTGDTTEADAETVSNEEEVTAQADDQEAATNPSCQTFTYGPVAKNSRYWFHVYPNASNVTFTPAYGDNTNHSQIWKWGNAGAAQVYETTLVTGSSPRDTWSFDYPGARGPGWVVVVERWRQNSPNSWTYGYIYWNQINCYSPSHSRDVIFNSNKHQPTIQNAKEHPKSAPKPKKPSTGGTPAPRNLSGH